MTITDKEGTPKESLLNITSGSMKMWITFSIAFLSFFINYGCSSDGGFPSITTPTDDSVDPGPEPVVLDSSTAIYRQFFFKGTHNSYSGNLAGMKREGIETQLEAGLRFFEFDLFSFHTQKELQATWTEDVDAFSVFDSMGDTYMLTYMNATGKTTVYKVLDGETEITSEKTEVKWEGVERKFSIVSRSTGEYIFGYAPGNGDLTIYSFNGSGLEEIHSENIGVANIGLSAFVFNDNVYLGVHAKDGRRYDILKVSFDEGAVSIGASIYELASVSSDENLYPFEQDNRLYLFRHNVNTVTNFSVESVDTNGNKWSRSVSTTGTSGLLKGTVQAVQADGKLFVNSYAANGNVVGSQLVMDSGTPVLVYEYNNEDDMLSGADAGVYPSRGGYFLLLDKGVSVQLSKMDIGVLSLGHDAPGDEVDLAVDNPQSIFLADWIEYLAQWSNAHPDHEPLFIMTELKEYEQWLADAKWQNIINLMQDKFGEKLRYHSSSGFRNEPLVDYDKIVDGRTLYFMDEKGSKEGGLLGKVILYIQPNNKITKSEYTNDFEPFKTSDGILQENFLQLKRYRENNKLVSPDWRHPNKYGNDIGAYIDAKDDSYISRIFHMESADGNGQYDNIHCTDVMFGVSDRPYEGLYMDYAKEQRLKNRLEKVVGCD